jgi:hypothetical protein
MALTSCDSGRSEISAGRQNEARETHGKQTRNILASAIREQIRILWNKSGAHQFTTSEICKSFQERLIEIHELGQVGRVWIIQ